MSSFIAILLSAMLIRRSSILLVRGNSLFVYAEAQHMGEGAENEGRLLNSSPVC